MVARVYRLSWRGWIFPLIVLAAGIDGTVGHLTGSSKPYSRDNGMFGSVSLMVGGVLLAISAFSSKVILSDDAIEMRTIFSKNRLLFSEIRGRRESADIGLTGSETVDRIMRNIASSWKLEPTDNKLNSININNSFALDDAFYEWFNQIPDLDDEDVTNS